MGRTHRTSGQLTGGTSLLGRLSALDTIPAPIRPTVVDASVTSALAGGSRWDHPATGPLAWAEFAAPRDARYLRQVVPEGAPRVGALDLPVHFLEEELLPLDVSDDEAVLEFFRRWGVTCAPYFGSRARFSSDAWAYDLRERAEVEARGEAWLGGRVADAVVPRRKARGRGRDRVLAHMLVDAARLGDHEGAVSSPDAAELVTKLREPVSLSDAIRAELFFREEPVTGIVSWDEAVASLAALRECVAYALAADMLGKGGRGEVARLMRDELGVEPALLNYGGEHARGQEIDLSDASVAQFLNACLFRENAVSVNRFGSLDAEGGLPEAEAWMTRARGGIESVIALHALQLLELPLPWRMCDGCGRRFKVYKRNNGDTLRAHIGRRERRSDFCCPACQRRSKRADARRARALATKMIERNPEIYIARSENDTDRARRARISLMKEVNSAVGAHKFVDDGSGTADRDDAIPAVLRMGDVDKLVEEVLDELGRRSALSQ